MVLENDSSSTAYEDGSDSSPASDEDQYSSSPQRGNVDINATDLKAPMPILGPLFGYTTPDLIRFVNTRIQYESKILERSLTQDEATAIAFYTSRAYSMSSYGPPLGLAIGFYRAYTTQNEYRFPFLRKNPETFNPNKLLNLEGRAAQLGWHSLRWTAYGLMGSWLGKTLAFSYALATRMSSEQQDKRLEALNKAEADYAREVMAKRRSPVPVTPGRSGPRAIGQPRADGSEQLQGDDMQAAASRDGFYSDSRMQENETRAQPSASQSRAENRASTFQMNKVAPQPTSYGDSYDDASPTAPSFDSNDNDSSNSNSSGSGSESAWNRVRRQAGSPQSQNQTSGGSFGQRPSSNSSSSSSSSSSSPQSSWARRRGGDVQQESQESSTAGDVYSFSQRDEDRQLAKSEAQREFDARIERERQGGDFSSDDRRRG